MHRSNDEFVSRLKTVFGRFRKRNLYLKAGKCSFGFKELEFVVKVVSEAGLEMSQARTQSVLDFPLPIVGKQLKSFLGTVNYLRDFVLNYFVKVKPLYDLITNYDKTRKIVRTPETTSAYNKMKLQVSKCSTMHFLSDTAPITLHSDASDYGVGGYLLQTVNGIGQPVALDSKFLNKFQRNILFFSFLRGRLFTIRTDH